MKQLPEHLDVGQWVTVVQQIPHRSHVWTTRVTGCVESYEQRKTGSWFAHAKEDRLWLDRLVLRKEDGELVVCNLDQFSTIEPGTAPQAPAEANTKDDVEADLKKTGAEQEDAASDVATATTESSED